MFPFSFFIRDDNIWSCEGKFLSKSCRSYATRKKNKATAEHVFSRTSLPFVFHHLHLGFSACKFSVKLALLKRLVTQEPEKLNALAGNLYRIAKLIVFHMLIACNLFQNVRFTESHLARRESRLARREMRGGNLLLSGTASYT